MNFKLQARMNNGMVTIFNGRKSIDMLWPNYRVRIGEDSFNSCNLKVVDLENGCLDIHLFEEDNENNILSSQMVNVKSLQDRDSITLIFRGV